MSSYRFKPQINELTRFLSSIREIPSQIDNFWVIFSLVYVSDVIVPDLTDYCPIFLNLPKESNNNSTAKNKTEPQKLFTINLHYVSRIHIKLQLEIYFSNDMNTYAKNLLKTINNFTSPLSFCCTKIVN